MFGGIEVVLVAQKIENEKQDEASRLGDHKDSKEINQPPTCLVVEVNQQTSTINLSNKNPPNGHSGEDRPMISGSGDCEFFSRVLRLAEGGWGKRGVARVVPSRLFFWFQLPLLGTTMIPFLERLQSTNYICSSTKNHKGCFLVR